MLKTIEGGRLEYTSTRWYAYEVNKLVHNIDSLDKIFPGRRYISGEDIIDYISYCKHGCFLLLEEMREMKKKLRMIEERVRAGQWLNKNTASVCRLTSDNINIFFDSVNNIQKLAEFTNLIHEDVYVSYFYNTFPNIYLPDPKVPQFPNFPRQSVDTKNEKKIKHLLVDTIPYLNVLEKYHMNIYKLVSYCNEGLDKLLLK